MKSQKPFIKRFAPLLAILAALVAAVAIVTPIVAYYIRTAGAVSNDYTAAQPANPSFVLGNGADTIKDVRVTVPDEGYPVYVRAAIVVTWKIKDTKYADDGTTIIVQEGDVFFGEQGAPLEGLAYAIAYGKEDWERIDGLWYYTKPILHNDTNRNTSVLINSCTLQPDQLPDNCVLSVEIIVQTVQAIGSTDGTNEIPAWEDAWGVKL